MITKKTNYQDLELLAKRFDQWRESRSNVREKFPDGLFDQAFMLTETLPASKVWARLGISSKQVKARQPKKMLMGQEVGIDFVSVPAPQQCQVNQEVCPSQPSLPLSLEFTRIDGSKLVISGLCILQMDTLLNRFMGDGACCN